MVSKASLVVVLCGVCKVFLWVLSLLEDVQPYRTSFITAGSTQPIHETCIQHLDLLERYVSLKFWVKSERKGELSGRLHSLRDPHSLLRKRCVLFFFLFLFPPSDFSPLVFFPSLWFLTYPKRVKIIYICPPTHTPKKVEGKYI